jgi:hypothetical protein
MENIHIRLENDEALFTKREILNSEINSLQALKAFKSFKSTRKRELILRAKLKSSLSTLRMHIEEIEKVLPTAEEEEPQLKLIKKLSRKKEESKDKVKKPEKKEYKEIENQLLSIKEKLDKLG